MKQPKCNNKKYSKTRINPDKKAEYDTYFTAFLALSSTKVIFASELVNSCALGCLLIFWISHMKPYTLCLHASLDISKSSSNARCRSLSLLSMASQSFSVFCFSRLNTSAHLAMFLVAVSWAPSSSDLLNSFCRISMIACMHHKGRFLGPLHLSENIAPSSPRGQILSHNSFIRERIGVDRCLRRLL